MHEENGILQRYEAINLSVSVHQHVVYFIGVHPNSAATVTDLVVQFLGNDSNRDVVLQQSERSDEPGWPTTSHEYRRNRRRHDSATK
jgi:hypothetical protein